MTFTVERIEFITLIIVRMSAFVSVAPFFGLSNISIKFKIGLSMFLTILVAQIMVYVPLEYAGVIGYASLVIKEAITGLLIGILIHILSDTKALNICLITNKLTMMGFLPNEKRYIGNYNLNSWICNIIYSNSTTLITIHFFI